MPLHLLGSNFLMKIILGLISLGLLTNPMILGDAKINEASKIIEIHDVTIDGIEEVIIKKIGYGTEVTVKIEDGDEFGAFIDKDGKVFPDNYGRGKDGEIIVTNEKHKRITANIMEKLEKTDGGSDDEEKNDKNKKSRTKKSTKKAEKTTYWERLKKELANNFLPKSEWRELNISQWLKKLGR